MKKNETEITSAAAALGRKGGSAKSEAKTAAARENAKKGGRPSARANVEMLDGTVAYLTLPEPLATSDRSGREDATGVWYTGLYYGPRTKRAVLRYYSVWDDGTGRCKGRQYREVDADEFLRLCDHFGVEPPVYAEEL